MLKKFLKVQLVQNTRYEYNGHERKFSVGELTMLSNIGVPGLILILIVALVIFGPNKLPEIGRAFGRSIREFKRATEGIADDIKEEIKEDIKEVKEEKIDIRKK